MYQRIELNPLPPGQAIKTITAPTSLDLSSNYLGLQPITDLVGIMQNFPTLAALKISNNLLSSKPATELVLMMQTLPQNLTSLDLSHNGIGRKLGSDLVPIIQALPQNLTSLNLSHNFLSLRDSNELVLIMQSLPQSLTTLDLRGNSLANKTETEFTNLLNALPLNMKTVIVDDKTICIGSFRDPLVVSQLLTQVSALISKGNKQSLAFDTISLPFEIDEARLNRIISVFEQQKTSTAYLICGLLLEGQIPTISEQEEGTSEYKHYMEKRTHDAISFYTKAAIDTTIRPLAEFLLWEIKQTNCLFSVQKQLEEYDLSPTYLIESFNKTKKHPEIKSHLLNELGLFRNSMNSLTSELPLPPERLAFS